MATSPRTQVGRKVDYPTSDGRPMAETDVHRDLMVDLIETLKDRYRDQPQTYVSGNLMLFYEEGNKRKHISPDVFLVRGIPDHRRDYYLMWLEGKGPDLAIEITSKSTRSEDVKKKMALYRDVLKVGEYFLFDPFQDYLKPPMQGYRLAGGRYEPIPLVEGRLGSEILGLDLERVGAELRLRDPETGRRLPTTRERADGERQRADIERAGRIEAEAENARLRERIEALQRPRKNGH